MFIMSQKEEKQIFLKSLDKLILSSKKPKNNFFLSRQLKAIIEIFFKNVDIEALWLKLRNSRNFKGFQNIKSND